MSQPITHYFVAREALRNSLLWNGYEKHIALGTLGPDLFYMCNPVVTMGLEKIAKVVHLPALEELSETQKAFGGLADAIHRDQSLKTFITMVSIATPNYRNGSETEKDQACRQIAFALGFYAHVITDCILHPLVYRVSGDHWRDHPEPGYTQHKVVEASLDFLLSKEVKDNIAAEARGYVQGCTSDNDNDQLDESVRSIFMQALQQCYPDILDEIPAFKRSECEDRHPLNQSFKDVSAIVGYLYEAGRILQDPWKLHLPLIVTKAQHLGQELDARTAPFMTRGMKGNWCNSRASQELSYNAFELIDRAIAAIRYLDEVVIAYLDDPEKNGVDDLCGMLAEYGCRVNLPYLQEDFNLDTGLPARRNNEQGVVCCGDEWFDFGVDELREIYEKLLSSSECTQ